jgi:hypothetical protein
MVDEVDRLRVKKLDFLWCLSFVISSNSLSLRTGTSFSLDGWFGLGLPPYYRAHVVALAVADVRSARGSPGTDLSDVVVLSIFGRV